MDDRHMLAYFERLKKERIRFIHGHISSVAIFARFLIERGLSYQLKAVLGASEQVFSFQRQLVEKAFGTRLFTWYGQTEQVALAGECECSELYHIFPEYGIVELVDEKGDTITAPGIVGEIVGTSFNNYAMPFIRYRTGDMARYSFERCKCGRAYPLLEGVEGRRSEYIVTEDGRLISLTGLMIAPHFKAYERIIKIQLYQERKGHVEIRIVKAPSYTDQDEAELRAGIRAAAPSGLEVTFRYVDDIPPTERGKHRFLIQALPITNEMA